MSAATETRISELTGRYPVLAAVAAPLKEAIDAIVAAYRSGGTLLVAGNGGSAADADHICGELLKGFKSRRTLPADEMAKFAAEFGEEGVTVASELQGGLRAISLLSHPGFCTAFANDVDADLMFAQQLWAQGRSGDVFIGITTGGNAANIRTALIAARVRGVRSILLTGSRHGICERYADIVIAVPESETYRVQELHLPVYHAICLAVEAELFDV